jgi:hypothetical protein
VCAVHVCVRHNHDPVVPQLLLVKLGPADAQTQSRDQRLELCVLINLGSCCHNVIVIVVELE